MINSGTTVSNLSAPEIIGAEPSSGGLVVSLPSVSGVEYQLLTGIPQVWVDVPGEINETASILNVALPWNSTEGALAMRATQKDY